MNFIRFIFFFVRTTIFSGEEQFSKLPKKNVAYIVMANFGLMQGNILIFFNVALKCICLMKDLL